MFVHLWSPVFAYRGFILGSVKREFQSRYSNSMLGFLWTVLNPLAMIAVYTVVFSKVMHARISGLDEGWAYSSFLCAGLLTWGLFAEVTTRSLNMFLENANLLKKLTFPRVCIPIIVMLRALVNFAIIFGLFLGFLLIARPLPGTAILAFPALLLIQLVFSVGLGLILGVLNVFFRDVGQLFGIVLQFWFWLTPVVYPISILPDYARRIVQINPMTSLIVAYQQVFVMNQWPHWIELLPIVILSLLMCAGGFFLFRAKSGEMVDEL